MRILDRYILKNTFIGYIFVLIVFVGLYFIIDLFSSLADILKAKPSLSILAQYYGLMIPLIFMRVSFFALLISVIYSVGEMNKTNEIISMRSSGLSIVRVAFPILFLAIVLSFISFFVQEQVLVRSQKRVEEIKIRYIKKDSDGGAEKKNFAFPSEDMIFFVRKFSPKEHVMEDVAMFQENMDGDITKKIVAAHINYDGQKWIGTDIIEYSLNETGNISDRPIHWNQRQIPLEYTPQELALKQSAAQYGSLKSLKTERYRLKKIHAYHILANLTIDYNQRIADPFTHFFLIIGILPFVMEIKKRKVMLSSVGTGFMFGFLYYFLFSFSVALGKAGTLLPALSVWVTPLFFLTVGVTGLLLLK